MKNNKTIDSVVKDGLCTGCGTCVGICPLSAIEMIRSDSKGIYIPCLDEEKCNRCGICFEACPGHAVDFMQLNSKIFDKQPEDVLLGNYLNCYIGHATNYDIRYNSASGGLATALLIFALEQGIIDGALVTKMNQNNPLEPQPFIATTREEIISASKSKYCPVPANVALKGILNSRGRFAIVGLPCHIHGIRKAEEVNRQLKEKAALHLGIFCSHTPSFLATEYLLHKMKIRKEDVKQLEYRGEGWPGKLKVDLEDGATLLPEPDYWGSGFGSFFCPTRCTLCCDHVAELADISLGDAWLPELEDDRVGSSIIISRSKSGEDILQKAMAKGKIELIETGASKAIQSQSGALNYKKSVGARISLFRLVNKKVPAYNTMTLKSKISVYRSSIIGYFRMYLGSKRCLWRFISPLIKVL